MHGLGVIDSPYLHRAAKAVGGLDESRRRHRYWTDRGGNLQRTIHRLIYLLAE